MHQFVMNVESNFKLGTFMWPLRPSHFPYNGLFTHVMWCILWISCEVDKSHIICYVNNSCILSPFTCFMELFEEVSPHILCHSQTERYHSACKISRIHSFRSIFYGIFDIILFLLHNQYMHPHAHRNFYEFNYFEWRKWNFIALRCTKIWSEIKCIHIYSEW